MRGRLRLARGGVKISFEEEPTYAEQSDCGSDTDNEFDVSPPT